MNEIVKDPVCHMDVPAASLATEFEGIHYAFCSEQCRERFLLNPYLYTGYPGHKAPAQQGIKVVKVRSFALSTPLDSIEAEKVRRALLEMMGIHEVDIGLDKIEIHYDLIQATAEQISDKLELIGTELGGGWKDRLKLAFINYLEECEIGNLEVENKKGHH